MEIINLKSAANPDQPSGQSLKVTDIKQAVKNINRVNIFINEKYEFSLDIAQLVDFKLKIGTILTPEDLEKYKKASQIGKTYQRLLEWALTRPHSVQEAKDYLHRREQKSSAVSKAREGRNGSFRGHPQSLRGCSDEPREDGRKERPRKEPFAPTAPVLSAEEIQELLDKMLQKGYLNDEKFAEYYVENRFVKKGISKKRLTMELRKKGISQEIIEKVLAKNLRSDEEEIKKIIQKKSKKYDEQKLIMYLVRQGFDFKLARTLVRDSSETDL